MKKIFTLILPLFLLINSAYSQDRYVVFFTDKNNSPFSLTTPLDYLSQRAIDRRSAQGISITVNDLPVNPSYTAGVTATGASLLGTTKWFNAVIVWANANQINQISSLPFVAGFDQVGRYGTQVTSNKFDKEHFQRTADSGLPVGKIASFNYGTSFNQISMLNGHMMHDNGYTGAGLVIAVLDAGFLNVDIMACFDSLRNNGRLLSTYDFVDPGSSVYNDDSHGAMVLSAMAAILPGDMVGTAPHASYHLLRSENAPSEDIIEEYFWASAAEYADSAGADIINSSLGYTLFDDPSQNHTYSDLNGHTTPIAIAGNTAASKGMIVVNSAGNEGDDPWFHISTPADGDSVLAVGAVDASSNYANFSGKGPSFDGRVKPDVAAQGEQAVVVEPWSGLGDATITANGTSFSSPITAGMMACLWQCNPTASNMMLIDAIRQSAHQFNNPDSLMGYGIPDFTQACLILGGIDPGIALLGDKLTVEGNPFSNNLIFSIYSNDTQKATIRIIDMLGKTVYKSSENILGITMNRFEYNIRLPKGVYTLEVYGEKSVLNSKIISDQ